MKVVVVESPAKAKTINKYLGSDYKVVASYGHVRDLPAKDGSVLPDADFAMSWEVDGKSEKHLKTILEAVRGADRLFLATDPDREGEAISWHVREVLNSRRGLKHLDIKRVVFNEVTKNAVLDAFTRPREIDRELVEAYLARRALDYLVGFTLSPVLWRKLPGSRSAGRVQSVALRLVCERESEIEAFKSREYWTIEVEFKTEAGQTFTARLTHLDGKRLERFDLDSEAKARAAADAILRASGFTVAEIDSRQVRRNPFPPFTTSTLQQEASRKLGLSANRTMQIAQRLYEGIELAGETVGLITYMRTDGVAISAEAIAAARQLIGGEFGPRYLPDAPRVYRSPAKNAQEAHEAIRPTDLTRKPADVARHLDRDQLRLYELIWKRTVASQMASALLEQVAVDIADAAGRLRLRANGSVILFDGFLTLYQEDRDDTPDGIDLAREDEGGRLPAMRKAERLARGEVTPSQHFTQPPPRYSEASLVKKLEELGIGRPSTYASILQVLQDRDYVRLEKRRFVPEDRGRLVTAFLTNFFERYVEYNFTADLENQLDDVSGGRIDWKEVLRNFWRDFSAAIDGTKELTITEVLTALDEALAPHFFPNGDSGHDPRLCRVCGAGRLSLKLGKFGAFIGCSNYPNCRFTRPLAVESEAEATAPETALGTDPGTSLAVTLKKGPYGHYVQLGEGNGEFKPKRVALPRSLKPAEIDLETALRLLALPRELGRHPETGEAIVAGIGRFGAYIKHGSTFKSLGADDDVLTIGLNRAVVLLAEPSSSQRRGPQLVRELGAHPEGGTIGIYRGRYGPYVSHDGDYASLPRNADPATFSLAEALPLLAAQRAKGKKRGRKPAKSASAKATLAKTAPAKAAKNGATTEATKKIKTAKKTGAAKKTAATKTVKTGVDQLTAKTPRARSGPAPR
jgi:DNA topoisomerase I